MSFMSGFADAFDKQISQGEAQRAQAQQDAFQMAYSNYLQKQAQYNSDQRTDKALVIEAQNVASMAGQPGAWQDAYTLLKTGSNPNDIIQRIKSSTYAAVGTPAMIDSSTQPQAMPNATGAPTPPAMSQPDQGGGMATQMGQGAMGPSDPTQPQPMDLMSGSQPASMPQGQPAANGQQSPPAMMPQQPATMGQPTPPVAQAAQPAPGQSKLGGFPTFTNPFDQKAIAARDMGQVNAKIQGGSGLSSDQYNQVMGGYQSDALTRPRTVQMTNTPTDLTPNNAGNLFMVDTKDGGQLTVKPSGTPGGWVDVTGKPVDPSTFGDQPIPSASVRNTQIYAGDLGKVTDPINQNRSAITSFGQNLMDASDYVKKNPTAMTRISVVPNVVNEALNEVNAAVGLLSSGDSKGAKDAQKKVQDMLLSTLNPNMGQDAKAAQEFQAMKTNLVFQLATIKAGNARSMSDQDFNKIEGELLSINDPGIFASNSKLILSQLMRGSDNDINAAKYNISATNAAKNMNVDINSQFMPWDDKISKWAATDDTSPVQGDQPTQQGNGQQQQAAPSIPTVGTLNQQTVQSLAALGIQVPKDALDKPYKIVKDAKGNITGLSY